MSLVGIQAPLKELLELESFLEIGQMLVSIIGKVVEKGPKIIQATHYIQKGIIKLTLLILGGCQGNHDCEIDRPFCHQQQCWGKLLTSYNMILSITIYIGK